MIIVDTLTISGLIAISFIAIALIRLTGKPLQH